MSFKGTVRATRPTDWKRFAGNLNDEITGDSSQLSGGSPVGTYVAGAVVGDPSPGGYHVTSGYMQFATSWAVQNQLPFTMAVLFKVDSPGTWNTGTIHAICGGEYHYDLTVAGTGSMMVIDGAAKLACMFGEPNNGPSYQTFTSTGRVDDGSWHMGLMTSDGANSPTLAGYLDGGLIGNITLSSTLVRLGNATLTGTVGVGGTAAGYVYPLAPLTFDEFILWNRPLSAGEVAMLWDEVSRGYAPGTYQEPLAPRYNYDQDGTSVIVNTGTGTNITLTSSEVRQIVDEDTTTFTKNITFSGAPYLQFNFPVAMDIYHINYYGGWAGLSGGGFINLEYSADGATAWTAIPGYILNTAQRTFPMSTSQPLGNIKGLRFRFNSYGGAGSGDFVFSLMHFYGLPHVSAAPSSVALWHPVADTPLPGGGVDFGDVGPTTVRDRQFRLKNLHGSLTASGTLLTLAALTDVSPSLTTEYQFSVGGGSFGSTAAVGDISPGALSPIITMRRIGASGAPAGLHAIQVDIAATFV